MNPPTMNPPDWDKWRLVPEVEIWEGVALSMSIAPEDVRTRHWMVGPEYFFIAGKEFDNRLFVAERCLSNKYVGRLVPMTEFSAWCQGIGWKIPPELAALGTQLPPALADLPETPPAPLAADPEPAGKPGAKLFRLIEPGNKDDWFLVIRAMSHAFHEKNRRMPNETEGWARLWDNPPPDYGIKPGEDKGGEAAVLMGDEALSKSAFKKRWKRYTRQ